MIFYHLFLNLTLLFLFGFQVSSHGIISVSIIILPSLLEAVLLNTGCSLVVMCHQLLSADTPTWIIASKSEKSRSDSCYMVVQTFLEDATGHHNTCTWNIYAHSHYNDLTLCSVISLSIVATGGLSETRTSG